MTGSLRARLLWWYTAMLAIVIVVFGVIVWYVAWRARLADIDALLRERAETLSRGLQPVEGGAFDLTLPSDLTSDLPYHAIWTPSGTLLDESEADLDIPRPEAPGFRTRSGRRELAVMAGNALLVVGRPLDDVRADIGELALTMAGVGAVAVLASIAGGLWLITRALAPVRRINDTARAMVDGDFQARIGVDRTDTELGQLARALNEAFDRLHAALARQRRFTADASHELRTPLATMSTELQWALGRDRAAEDYRRSLDVCRRATARMTGVVERLLSLARADAGAPDPTREIVRLDQLVRAVADDLQPLYTARALAVRIDAEPVSCLGDPDGLTEAVSNVVMNAIQYTEPGGEVRITVGDVSGTAQIVVADTGIGIAPVHLERVFEPFFRAEPARTRATGGAGLGLAVTRTTIARHGGEVTLQSEPGRGTIVAMKLPAAPTT